MIMCSETKFTQEKCNFHPTIKSSIPPFTAAQGTPVPPDDHLQPQKGHEKYIFETIHNEIKCVLSIKESKFQSKSGLDFHICLQWPGPRWLTPPPLTVSMTVKHLSFYNFP